MAYMFRYVLFSLCFFVILQDFLGQMECSLGEIVSAGRLKRALK